MVVHNPGVKTLQANLKIGEKPVEFTLKLLERTPARVAELCIADERRSAKIRFVPNSCRDNHTAVRGAGSSRPTRWIYAASCEARKARAASVLRQLCNSCMKGLKVGTLCERPRSAHRLDPGGQARDLARSIPLVDDALLRRAHQNWLRCRERATRSSLIAGRQCFLDLRTCDLYCERRDLLISVRRIILRAAFLAELVLAIRPPPFGHVMFQQAPQGAGCGCYRPSQLAGSTRPGKESLPPPPSRPSAMLEVGFTLGDEGGHALLLIGHGKHGVEDAPLEADTLGQRCLVGAIDGFLGQHDRGQ